MSPQTKLRIYCMIAVMYEAEHENVISIIARYVLVNIFSENWLIVLGREIQTGQEDEKRKKIGDSELYKRISPMSLTCSKKGHCSLHNC